MNNIKLPPTAAQTIMRGFVHIDSSTIFCYFYHGGQRLQVKPARRLAANRCTPFKKKTP